MLSMLGNLWRAFDAFGRKFINTANPILGTPANERTMLADAERQRKAKGRDDD